MLDSHDLSNLPIGDDDAADGDDDAAELFGDDHQLIPTLSEAIPNPQQVPWDDEYLRGPRPIPETLAAVVDPFALLSEEMNTFPQAYINTMLFPTLFSTRWPTAPPLKKTVKKAKSSSTS